MRNLLVVCSFFLGLSLSGCVGDQAVAPTEDELSNYIAENPEAASFDSNASIDDGDMSE